MKHIKAIIGITALSAAVPCFAAGTTAGTTVSNTAIVDFSIGTVSQTAIPSSPTGNSDPNGGVGTDFLVDRKIDLIVSETSGGYTSVSPGQQDAALVFTVTNEGNAIQDYSLSALNISSDPFGGADNVNVNTSYEIFVDSNNNGIFERDVDTATYIDELAQDASATVFVVSNIAALADGDISSVALVAQAAEGGTADTQGSDILADSNGNIAPGGTAVTIADGAGTVETVFADSAGDIDSSGANGALSNAQHADTDSFKVASAVLLVSKTSEVIADTLGGVAPNAKAIPGATVRYTITVDNQGSTSAENLTISDIIPSNTSYVEGSLTLNGEILSDLSDTDSGEFDATNNRVLATISGLAGSNPGPTESATITFTVTIN